MNMKNYELIKQANLFRILNPKNLSSLEAAAKLAKKDDMFRYFANAYPPSVRANPNLRKYYNANSSALALEHDAEKLFSASHTLENRMREVASGVRMSGLTPDNYTNLITRFRNGGHNRRGLSQVHSRDAQDYLKGLT